MHNVRIKMGATDWPSMESKFGRPHVTRISPLNRTHGQLNLFLSVIRFIAGIDNVKVILILISGVHLTFHLQWSFKNVKVFSIFTIHLECDLRTGYS